MAIEINEMIMRAHIQRSGEGLDSNEAGAEASKVKPGSDALSGNTVTIQDCVEAVLEILKDKKLR